MEIGKSYIILGDAPTGLRGKKVKVIKLTKTTVWLAFDNGKTYLYHNEFKAWAKEVTSWSGSKLIHNFI